MNWSPIHPIPHMILDLEYFHWILDIMSMMNYSEYIRTAISITCDPCAVHMSMVSFLFSDCCGCSQECCRDSSRLCRSTLSPKICSLLNTSQTTCSCDSFVALSICHFCQSSIIGDCCRLSSTPWNWCHASLSTLHLPPPNWSGLSFWSADRGPPPAALLFLHCVSCSAHFSSLCFEWNRKIW